MKKLFGKIGNFFKWIWGNKNSILAIVTSVASICLVFFVLLKGFILNCEWPWLNFIKDITPAHDVIPAVIAGEADVVAGINIGDILVAEIPAVYEGETLISAAIPAVIAGEADVVAAINIGDILVAEIPAAEAVVNGLNIWGYCILGVLSCGLCALDVYGIVNHYGIESVEQFAARMEERKVEVEAKLVNKEQIAEYKSKLSTFNKGLKELTCKIEDIEGKVKQIKTLIDSNLATGEQIANYSALMAEIANLTALKANYNVKIAEIKDIISK